MLVLFVKMRSRLEESLSMRKYADEDSPPLQPSGTPVDVNNYPPLDSFHLDDKPLNVQAVCNQLAQDIVIFTFRKRIAIYYFKVKVNVY